MNTPLPFEQQRSLFLAALKQAKKAGFRVCKPGYYRALSFTTEADAAAVLRDSAFWVTIYLLSYLPDGTYGAEGYVLFTVRNGKLHGEYREWDRKGQICKHLHFHADELHGECRKWDSDGLLFMHRLYQNGDVTKDHLLHETITQ